MVARTVSLGSLAKKITAESGVAWREMAGYPGFAKGCWTDDARWLIHRFIPGAVLIEGTQQWDGKVSEDPVANLSDEDMARLIETGRRRGTRMSFP